MTFRWILSLSARHYSVAVSTALVAILFFARLGSTQSNNPVPVTLAPIQLTAERRQSIGVSFAIVERRNVAESIETTGNIEADEKLQGYVQTRFPGWIEKVYANQTGQYVRKGEALFTVYSPDLVSTENEYLLALKQKNRVQSSRIDGVAAGADALVESASARLQQWGVSPREIVRLQRERTASHSIEIDAPMNGVIVDRAALPNMYVQPETRLFTITDLSRVWVYAAVFQDQIGKVRVGAPAAVTVDAYPGEKFDGRVDFIQPQIDPMTRTAKVRCEFVNRKGMLMPGMFVRVALHLPLGNQIVIRSRRWVPESNRSRAWTASRQRSDRAQGSEAGRSDRRVGELPDRFGKPASGRGRRLRSTPARSWH
jgi:RND family efflux transporter MFP subunit